MSDNENKIRTENLVSSLFSLYSRQGSFTVEELLGIYTNAVIFEDPLHRREGIQALCDYLNNIYQSVQDCRFERRGHWVCDETVFVQWDMYLVHTSLNGGKSFSVSGLSQLKCADRIFYHRDFFDAGEMLYEKVPVMGVVNRWLKRRAAS
jgi:hypothetical protein